MTRAAARRIAETITNEQIQEMFNNTKANFTDWTKVSKCNKGLSKGLAWNILAKDFDVEKNHHILAKTNFVREFGDYLPEHLKPEKKVKRIYNPPAHEDPIF